MADSIDYSSVTRTELVWPGKRTQVERIALPFQIAETVNQSRATRERTPLLAGLPPPPLFDGQTSPDTSWKNKLIWGENKYVMASLLQGDPSIGLEPLAGKINLIYIDPPFATGQDFSYRARVGDPSAGSGQVQEWVKEASIIEEVAYRDTWGRGLDSYLQMMYERMVLMRDLLAEDGSIYVHIGPDASHSVKVMMDEIFGADRFINEIVWQRINAHSDTKQGSTHYGRIHDVILFYTKTDAYKWQTLYAEYSDEYVRSAYRNEDERGRFKVTDLTAAKPGGDTLYEWKGIQPSPGRYWAYSREHMQQLDDQGLIYYTSTGRPMLKQYLADMPGLSAQDLWLNIYAESARARTGYDTQKPEKLLERIIGASSAKGDLVADFFCGSGTTMAVAEKLGRRWIGGDLSRYAIQVSRERLLDIDSCEPFQVLNLGKYERQHWQVHVNGSGLEPEEAIGQYQRFIVALYRAEPGLGLRPPPRPEGGALGARGGHRRPGD